MTLTKMDQLTLALETVKFQLSNYSTSDVTFNVEVWEDTLDVVFDANSDFAFFAFFDLQASGVFGNWKFNQRTLTMSVKL